MANTGLDGPYALSNEEIDRVVTRISPGVYVLGHSENGTFYVKYVGRSDNNINSRLKQWVEQYVQFKFGYFSSPKAAFEREGTIYHDFGGPNGSLDNKNHPQRPEGTDWQCSRCNVFAKTWY